MQSTDMKTFKWLACIYYLARTSTYSGISSQAVDFLAVLICQLEGSKLVFLLAHRIGLDDCAEDGEAILDIQGGVIAVAVYAYTEAMRLRDSLPRRQ